MDWLFASNYSRIHLDNPDCKMPQGKQILIRMLHGNDEYSPCKKSNQPDKNSAHNATALIDSVNLSDFS